MICTSKLKKPKDKLTYILSIGSLLSLLILFLFQGMDILSASNGSNDDIGWAVQNGWLFLHHFSTISHASWIANGYSVSFAEWGSDILFYLIYVTGGQTGLLVMLRVVTIALGIILFWRYRKVDNEWLLLLGIGVFSVLISGGITERSQLITYLLLAIYFFWRNGGMRKPWIWVIIAPIWALLHGGYMVFYVVFLIDAIFARRFRMLWLIPVAILLTVIVSPAHTWTILYPFVAVVHPFNQFVTEWQPFAMKGLWGKEVVALTVAAVALSWSSWRWNTRIMALFFLYSAFSAFRNVPLLGIFLVANLPLTIDWSPLSSLPEEVRHPLHTFFSSSSGLAKLILAVLGPMTALLWPILPPFQDVNQSALRVFLAHHLEDRPFYADIQTSDELALKGEPVYFDGRADVWTGMTPPFHPDIELAYGKVITGQAPVTTMPGYVRMCSAIVANRSLVDFELQQNAAWRVFYQNKQDTIFLRK